MTTPAHDWREKLKQEVVGMLHPEIYSRTCSFIENLLDQHTAHLVERIGKLKRLTKTQIPQINGDVADALDRHDINTIVMLWQHTLTDIYNLALVDVVAEIEFPETSALDQAKNIINNKNG